MENCGRCGARLAPGSEWCNQCYATTAPREATAQARGTFTPPFWIAEDPVPPPVYSRWRAGVTTFGPVGRIVSTIIVVAPAVLWFIFMKAAGFVFGDRIDERGRIAVAEPLEGFRDIYRHRRAVYQGGRRYKSPEVEGFGRGTREM